MSSVRSAEPVRAGALAVVVVLAAIASLAFGSHVLHGGFYNDDWSFLTAYRYRQEHTLWGAIEAYSFQSFRPGGMVYWALMYGTLGVNTSLFLAVTAALGVTMAALVYLVLRTLGMERLHAGAIAALVLIFPAADSTRLWTNASVSSLSIDLYLGGLLLALRGLRSGGLRAVAWHAGAVALYVFSVCTYELAAGAMLVSASLYAWRAGTRPALRRWVADATAVVATLMLVTSNTWNATQPLAGQIRHALVIAGDSTWLLKDAVLPFGMASRFAVLAPLAAIGLFGALIWRLLPTGDPTRLLLRRWLLTAGAAVMAIGVGYLMYVPAASYYAPLAPGEANRMNNLASIGYVLLIYSLVMIAATLLFRGLPNARRYTTALALLACTVLGAGWIQRVHQDGAAWDRAADLQAYVLNGIRRALPHPPRGAVIYAAGIPPSGAWGIPVFGATWDLDGAVKTTWRDATLRAFPLVPGSTVKCERGAMVARVPQPDVPDGTVGAYGRAFVVDIRTSRVERVDDRAACSTSKVLAGSPLTRIS